MGPFWTPDLVALHDTGLPSLFIFILSHTLTQKTLLSEERGSFCAPTGVDCQSFFSEGDIVYLFPPLISFRNSHKQMMADPSVGNRFEQRNCNSETHGSYSFESNSCTTRLLSL